MAEQDSGQERTEEPTPKRLKEARERGQVPRSRELNTMTLTLSGAGALVLLGEEMVGRLSALLRDGWQLNRAEVFDLSAGIEHLSRAVTEALLILGPLLILLFIAALVGPLALGGWSFSAKSLGFKWQKLDPVTGLARIFSLKGGMELAKTLLKFAVVAGASAVLLWSSSGALLDLGREPLQQAMAHAAHLLSWSFVGLSAVLILVAAVDVPFQVWDHRRQLKMTRQEIKDEMKESEGRPEVKGRIRALQREIAQRRMMEEVPKADVVIVNPTHYAVALRFDESMAAPRVVAKGADLIAARIRAVAEEHEITVFSAPPLARAIYSSTEIDQEIPSGLYLAVAQVLAYVYQLRKAGDPEQRPVPPSELPIPEEFVHGRRRPPA